MKAPNGWEKRRLGDVLTLINGRAYKKPELLSEGTPVIRIQNLNGGDRWYYSDLSLPENKYCEAGDLLFAWSATFGPYIWNGPKGIYHYHIWKIELGPELNKSFAFHLLQNITNAVKAAGRGISMIHMTKSGMEDWEIALPPLQEQRRIAGILDQADALRRLRTRALDKLNTLGQAIFHEMFGSPMSNPKEWPIKLFGECVENRDSLRVPVKQSDRDQRSGPYPYYGSVGVIDDIDDYLYDGEHLLVSEDGKHLESRSRPIACLADGKFWVNNHAHVVKDNGVADLVFLKTFLDSTSIKKHISGIDQIKLNRKSMDKIPVPLPPRELQDQFRNRLAVLNDGITSQKSALDSSCSLFASLQHRAFRGEL